MLQIIKCQQGQRRGNWDGLPLYRLVNGRAGIYWCGDAKSMQWNLTADWTEDNARAHKASATLTPLPGGLKLPMGSHTAKCYLGGKWQSREVTLAPTEGGDGNESSCGCCGGPQSKSLEQ